MCASNSFPTSKAWECYVCGRIFANLEQSKEHCYQQQGNLPYVCDLCGRAMKGVRPHVREICNKAFNHEHDLEKHVENRCGSSPVNTSRTLICRPDPDLM
ncbi:hypothetical protein CDAR_388411 [Caerostris darwini]|uniref:C2H2-type domain-containing protein n=1 Tax=Caerostris darwini TaxID=1538125 RepID=A0AAV4UXZ5_9ARAC|nr:hypothetical protein CDAR_388411 [Caerostris darwini]